MTEKILDGDDGDRLILIVKQKQNKHKTNTNRAAKTTTDHRSSSSSSSSSKHSDTDAWFGDGWVPYYYPVGASTRPNSWREPTPIIIIA